MNFEQPELFGFPEQNQDNVQADSARAAEADASLLSRLNDGDVPQETAATIDTTPAPAYVQPELSLVPPSDSPELQELLDETPTAWSRMSREGDAVDQDVAGGIMTAIAREMEEVGADPSALWELDPEEIAAAMEERGWSGRSGFRNLITDFAARDAHHQEKAKLEARFRELETEGRATREALPDGPLAAMAARMGRLEEMLTAGREEKEIFARADAETRAELDSHGGALDLLAGAVRARGGVPPDGEDVGRWYKEHQALNLPAAVAAKLCFESLGCEVTPRPDRRRESRVISSRVVRGNAGGGFIVPNASTGPGAAPELSDLLDEPDFSDDGGMRVWTGGR